MHIAVGWAPSYTAGSSSGSGSSLTSRLLPDSTRARIAAGSTAAAAGDDEADRSHKRSRSEGDCLLFVITLILITLLRCSPKTQVDLRVTQHPQ
jgi:hypothetical protein